MNQMDNTNTSTTNTSTTNTNANKKIMIQQIKKLAKQIEIDVINNKKNDEWNIFLLLYIYAFTNSEKIQYPITYMDNKTIMSVNGVRYLNIEKFTNSNKLILPEEILEHYNDLYAPAVPAVPAAPAVPAVPAN